MKNVFLLPTDKPSRLYQKENRFQLSTHPAIDWYISSASYKPVNIYITSDEEIKEGDWIKWGDAIYKANRKYIPPFKKIILTTDQNLIVDGVQSIEDNFLEWFVKNPSCESVEIDEKTNKEIQIELGTWGHDEGLLVSELEEWLKNGGELYKIIIPQEEPKQEYQSECICENSCRGFVNVKCKQLKKQETLEEAAERILLGEDLDLSDYDKRHILKAMLSIAKWKQEQDKKMYSEKEVIEIVEKSRATGLTAEYLILTEQFKKK
jgi:hypothetical protein